MTRLAPVNTVLQPVTHLSDLGLDKLFIMKGIGQGRHPLAAGQQMHGQAIGIRAAQLSKLPSQPVTKQGEYLICLFLQPMIQFRQLSTQGAHRATIQLNPGLVGDQNMNEAADTIGGTLTIAFPAIQQISGFIKAQLDDRLQDIVLGLEMVVEVAAGIVLARSL